MVIENALSLKEEEKCGVLIFHLDGRFDAISAPIIEKRTFDSIEKGYTRILFDFSQVSYLSSAGMRTLLSSSKKLKSLSGKLVLCSIKTPIMDVLRMSGFDPILEISKTEEEALLKF